MYSVIMSIAMVIFLVPVLIHFLLRAKKCFEAYASNNKFDGFDDSVIMETMWNMGNHPAGILIDTVVYGLIAVLGGLVWPVSVPCAALYCVAYKRRQEAVVVDTLKGDMDTA